MNNSCTIHGNSRFFQRKDTKKNDITTFRHPRLSKKNKALMQYLTDFSTASKMLNLNNPTLSPARIGVVTERNNPNPRRERSVGTKITLISSVSKTRYIEKSKQ
jgi:hypothetical protein